MKQKIYQVDAFTTECFKGNPAAVCPLDEWIEAEIMQKVAMENNLSETAFFVKEGDMYKLRWFTPEREIELCGHATLASAFVIFNYIQPDLDEILFDTMSGILRVFREDDKISMIFPKLEGKRSEVSEQLIEALGLIPIEVYEADILMIVLEDEDDVRYLQPNMGSLKNLGFDGIVVTSKGRNVDFVSRFFIPSSVISEDPVTGSAHCTLVPYWAKRLRKTDFQAKQLSKRGGKLYCELLDEKVKISGNAVSYLEGTILL